MNENLFETQYDVTKKSKIKKFYDNNRILIFSATILLTIIIAYGFYFFSQQERKKINLAENYIDSKISIKAGKKDKAKNILKEIVLQNDTTYSSLSLFLILNENLISDKNELLDLFDHLLKNNKFDKEERNLIIFKKVLFQSNFENEAELVEAARPILNDNTVWKPHTLLLLGDYFLSKKQNLKAKEFYLQVLSIKNLSIELTDYAKSRLMIIPNEQKN
jgi:predicted negative regulator of RcsB-dependent stress response